MRILLVGPLWRGSNAGGLFRALSRAGCLIEVIDEFYYVSLKTQTKINKVLERIVRPLQEKEFNDAIKRTIDTFRPAVLLVYKGVFVQPTTLTYARQQGCKLVLFYPDVSMTAHGDNIPGSIPLYDLIFTTKTFGIRDMKEKYGVNKAVFIPHGFDPEIHRPLKIGAEERNIFGCDVSFIGTWSPKKEKWLGYLKEKLPQLNLRVWGDQWDKTTATSLKSSIQGKPIVGDLYALAIQCSTINLGILSEQVSGASSGDLITSRTFHIPGASGFLLHERNEESVTYFAEDAEAAFFDGPEEMTQKVSYFIEHAAERETIRQAGYKRAWADHSLDMRAAVIINHLLQVN
ncbi:MAG: glycosyltransferase [Taibaiella sp.]|nr:glycosyltransferase [Taibaiella sp.]